MANQALTAEPPPLGGIASLAMTAFRILMVCNRTQTKHCASSIA